MSERALLIGNLVCLAGVWSLLLALYLQGPRVYLAGQPAHVGKFCAMVCYPADCATDCKEP